MPRWSQNELTRAQRRNPHLQVVGAWADAAVEPVLRAKPLGPRKAKEANPDRFLVVLVSVRRRLGDAESLVPKWHVDALRYAAIIIQDTADVLECRVTQRKCAKGEEEHTEITVWKMT